MLVGMFVIAISAGAAHPQCKENVKVVAACFSIHARANIGANSVPIYLWPIGTKRRLGVTGGPSLDDSIKPFIQVTCDSNLATTTFLEISKSAHLPQRRK